jgi:hydroxymethylpyrimidine pyrophosphatase-like HAD family hydrolase
VAAEIKLISTDFDGTLVPAFGGPNRFADELIDMLTGLRRDGVLWAVNTGRSPGLLKSAWEQCGLDFHPDFALTSERDVYRPCDIRVGEWVDYGDWNQQTLVAHRALFTEALPLLLEAIDVIKARTQARILYNFDHVNSPAEPAGLTTRTDSEMDWVVDYLDSLKSRLPKLHYQRNSIYLRFCHADYDKGTALAELGRLLEIPAVAIFAAGDHYNDLPMLDGRAAKHVACPANAIPEVKQTVRAAGGHVSGAEDGYGLVDALKRHFS